MINRKLSVLLILIYLIGSSFCNVNAQLKEPMPNIPLIMAGDFGYGGIGNIDGIGFKSILFNQEKALKKDKMNNSFEKNSKYSLHSPDNEFQMTLKFKDSLLYYCLTKNNKRIINESALGLIRNNKNLKLELIDIKKGSHSSTWKMTWGLKESVINSYNSLSVETIDRNSGLKINFLFRLYDNGLAFRYVFPKEEESFVIEEKIEFSIHGDPECFLLTHPWAKYYKEGQSLSQVTDVSLPLLCENTEGMYSLITEAALYNYGSLHLTSKNDECLISDIVGEVLITPPFSSPWRVIMADNNPLSFIENGHIIQNLNAPCKIKHTDWIQPGISFWDWRARGAKEENIEYSLNTETLLHFIKKAAQLGMDYFMIDAGWYGDEHDPNADPLTSISSINLPQVIKEASRNNIGLWLYVNKEAFENHNIDEIISTYGKWGIKGIKLGFLADQSQEGVLFLQNIVEKCAQYEIMFNCHECVIPSGIERTWPNFMTREYCHSLVDGRYISRPKDHTVTPFLNGMTGPLDVTPGFFDINSLVQRRYIRGELRSTVTAQAAMCMITYSPLLCLPDIPEAYERKPDLFDFIKSLPLTYDETIALAGEPGKGICIARKSDGKWWLSALSNENGQSYKIPLSFLNKGMYKSLSFKDGKNTTWQKQREDYVVEESVFSADDTLHIDISPGGGFCMQLVPVKP